MTCPLCGGALVNPHSRKRIVFDVVPARHVKRKYVVWRAWCPTCGEWHEVAPPGVMPRFAFSNNLIAQVLVDHMKNGIPLGTLARRAGVKKSALHAMEHGIAEMLEGGIDRILEEFRAAPVKHADETKWPERGTLRWGSGPQGPTVSASNPDALTPRAKPVPLPQAEGLRRTATPGTIPVGLGRCNTASNTTSEMSATCSKPIRRTRSTRSAYLRSSDCFGRR